jgi:NitT/TauT family transport system permease protein
MKGSDLFVLRGDLDKRFHAITFIIGLFFFLGLWQFVSTYLIAQSLLPSPIRVIAALKPLHLEDELVRNSLYSIKLNLLGYIEAILVALPLGFLIGLSPILRSAVDPYVKSLRFLPLAAATGIFIAWCGIGDFMKVQFLAVSIAVYLIPVVIQRINEVEEVYLQTAYTIGASKLQTVFSVFVPAVVSRVWEDIRVLVAISWTYITIAEMLNMTGGVGALAVKCGRRSQIDKAFAVLLLIIVFGVIQDALFKWIGRKLFKYKYI